MGLPAFYAVEFFSPHLKSYMLYSNETEDSDEEEATDDSEQQQDPGEA